jgi:peptide/nickel transport system permease protein
VTRHIVRRLVLLLPTLLGLSLFSFVLLRLIPGDPVQIMLGEHATLEQVQHFRAERGLDQPLPAQYLRYLGGLVRGDWGRSIKTNQPVLAELTQRLPATVELGLAALFLACLVGVPLGILAAHRHNVILDLLATGGALAGVSMPLFWLGLLLAYLFGYKLGWFPPSGRLSIEVGLNFGGGGLLSHFYLLHSLLAGNWSALLDGLRHLALPALTLSTVPLAVVLRMTRACVQEVLARDHIRTARAKGLTEWLVLRRHALRSALPPVLTVIGLQLGTLLSGAVLTETIFAWPGVGQLVVDRVLARDYPVVQGVILISALLVVLVNLATDVGYACLTPRIDYE